MAPFDRPHHNLIHAVLCSLDADLLVRTGACFGGGTLIALHHGEYRWSKDIDFVCPVGEGYRLLRRAILERGEGALFRSLDGIALPRPMRTDQYGVRLALLVAGHDEPLKLEIIAEHRLDLDPPELPSWSPVPVLALVDRFAEKLLANADRWADRSTEARDLIDLAVLRLYDPIPERAVAKAENAYPVLEPLRRALTAFQANAPFRRTCFDRLQVHDRRHVVDGLDLLAADLGLPPTARNLDEAGPEDAVLAGVPDQ